MNFYAFPENMVSMAMFIFLFYSAQTLVEIRFLCNFHKSFFHHVSVKYWWLQNVPNYVSCHFEIGYEGREIGIPN